MRQSDFQTTESTPPAPTTTTTFTQPPLFCEDGWTEFMVSKNRKYFFVQNCGQNKNSGHKKFKGEGVYIKECVFHLYLNEPIFRNHAISWKIRWTGMLTGMKQKISVNKRDYLPIWFQFRLVNAIETP